MGITNRIIWAIGLLALVAVLGFGVFELGYWVTGPHYITQSDLTGLAHCEATTHHYCW